MRVFAYTLLSLSLFCMMGCDLQEECSGSLSATYTMGSSVDVTGDFSDSDVAFTAEVLSSDCDSLSTGTTVDETVSSVTRTGNDIVFTTTDETINATIESGTSNIEAFSKTQSFPGCDISVSLSGTLNSVAAGDDTITTTGSFSATGLTCSSGL